MNPFFNGLFRGLASQAGQVIAGLIVTGVMGALGVDSSEDSQTDFQTDSQTDYDSTNEDVDA